jgi:hypothetical protein
MTHNCFSCHKDKELSAFPPRKRKHSKLGIHGTCRECKNKRRRELHNPSKDRELNLKLRFGITIDQYNQLFNEQKGCCGICKRHQSEFKKALAVDHCHITLQIRGLLCDNCNRAVGQLKDSIFNLQNAITYLQNTNNSLFIPSTAKPSAYRN